MEYPVSSPSRTHRYIHPSLFVCTARSMSEEIVERPSPLLLVPPSLFLHRGGERNGREWRRRASLSCPPQNPFPPLLLAGARPPHQCTLDLRPLPSPPSRWTERARTHACATKTRTHIFLEILANLARDATRFALSLSTYLYARSPPPPRTSLVHVHQPREPRFVVHFVDAPFLSKATKHTSDALFPRGGEEGPLPARLPLTQNAVLEPFCEHYPDSERWTPHSRRAYTRIPFEWKSGPTIFFVFFFYFYANGVFFFSRDGAVTQEREKKKRRRNIRLVFRLRSFNRRWISYLEQGFVRIIENTFRFIVSLKCEFSIEPISRTQQESPFPVPLTKWRLRYFRAVISHVNIVVLPDCATYLITTTTVLRREISFSDASVRTFYMLRDAVVRI